MDNVVVGWEMNSYLKDDYVSIKSVDIIVTW